MAWRPSQWIQIRAASWQSTRRHVSFDSQGFFPAGIDHKAVAKVPADETLCHLIAEQDSLSYVMLLVRC